MTLSTNNNLQIAPVTTHELDLERFKPYQYRSPATFAIILENFLKLIANQFIHLGNFLDKTFFHIENPPPKEKSTDLVAKRVLSPKLETRPTLEKPAEPAAKPKRNTTLEAPKTLTNQDYLQRFLNDVPGFERIDLSHKVRPLNPHEIMLPSVWDEIFEKICERVWGQLPEPKELKPTDIFKNEINALIRNSFTEDKYRFFENFYLKHRPDLKKELSQLEQKAKVSGGFSAAAVAGLSYFAGDLLLPNQLAEFITNETGLSHLSSSVYLLLWGLAILHLTQKMGVKQPSLEDVKNFFKHSFSTNPSVLLDNIYQGCTLKQLKTITYDTAASLFDKIYKKCTKENLIELGRVAGSLYFERYFNCIRQVTTTGVNFLINSQLLPSSKHPVSEQQKEKTEYFKRKQKEFSSAANARISMTRLGWKGLESTGSLAYKAALISKNVFSSLAHLTQPTSMFAIFSFPNSPLDLV